MRLAGNVKLRHFLLAVALLATLLLAGIVLLVQHGDERDQGTASTPPPGPELNAPAPEPGTATGQAGEASAQAAPAETVAQAAPAAGPSSAQREVDRLILSYVGRDLGTKKIKDASRGRPYKVNLYQDEGHSSLNRAKVDLDRDDRWDEKWTIDGQEVTRKVAPADDEDYTEKYRWDGSQWVPLQ